MLVGNVMTNLATTSQLDFCDIDDLAISGIFHVVIYDGDVNVSLPAPASSAATIAAQGFQVSKHKTRVVHSRQLAVHSLIVAFKEVNCLL